MKQVLGGCRAKGKKAQKRNVGLTSGLAPSLLGNEKLRLDQQQAPCLSFKIPSVFTRTSPPTCTTCRVAPSKGMWCQVTQGKSPADASMVLRARQL